MNTLKKIFFVVPCLLFFTIAYGSNYYIAIDSTLIVSGKVIDSATSKPLQLVSIHLFHLDDTIPVKTVLTNDSGEFELTHTFLPFFLKFNFIGYTPLVRKFESQTGRKLDVGIIRLNTIDNMLQQVKVTANKPTLELTTGGYRFNADNNIIGSSTNMAELLKQVPGLTIDEVEGKLQLLGKGPGVLINGRKVNMGGKDLLTYLRSLPSGDVLSINVLTNPGAAYDSSGEGGILDIRLKKNPNLGFFGSASASISTLWGTDESINLNLKKSKFDLSLGYNYSSMENLYRRNDRITNHLLPDSNYLYKQAQLINRSQQSHSLKTSISYNIDSTSIVSLSYWYAYVYALDPIEKNVDVFDRSNNFQRQIRQKDRNFLDNNFHIVDLLYNNDFNKKSKISLGLNYSDYSNENNMLFLRQAYNLSGIEINSSENENRNLVTNRPYSIWTLNADYKNSMSKNYELKFGAKYSIANTESTFRSLAINDNLFNGASNSEIEYNENLKSLYSSLSGKSGNISFEAGLRMESFDYKLRSLATDEDIKNGYLNLFPNFSARYNSRDDKNSVSISGNGRIERPGYNMLNPFVINNSLGYFSNGNPHLKPYFTNRVDAQYSHKFNNNHSLIFSVYISSSKDMFAYVTRFNEEMESSEFNYYNDYNQKQIGGYLMLQNRFGSRVNFSTYLSAQRPTFTSNVSNDVLLPGIINFNGSINIFINVLPKTTVQILGFYSSVRNSFQMKNGATGYVTVGIQQKALKDKLNINLTIEDIFDLREIQISSIGSAITIDSMNKLTSRFLKLSLNYNFGKSFSIKQVKKLEKDSRID